MAHLTFLEQFTTKDNSAPSVAPEELPGYSQGYTAGINASSSDAKLLNAKMVDKFLELRFGYAEAQHEILKSLTPLINAICDRILPDLIDDIALSEICETLLFAARSDSTSPISIILHPRNSISVQEIISNSGFSDFNIISDINLMETEVVIETRECETLLNVSEMIEKLRFSLQSIVRHKEAHSDE